MTCLASWWLCHHDVPGIIDKGYIQHININLLNLSAVSIKNNYMKLFRLMLNRYKSRSCGVNTPLGYELLIRAAIFRENIETLDIITKFDGIRVFKSLETLKDRNVLEHSMHSNKR
jgi:hypothetical protein